MKNLLKITLILIAILSSTLALALSPTDIADSPLTKQQQLDTFDLLSAAKTAADSTAVQTQFDALVKEVTDAAAVTQFEELRKQFKVDAQSGLKDNLIAWVSPDTMTIEKVLTDLPQFFTDNKVSTENAHFCIDYLGMERYKSLKLNSLDDSKMPITRTTAMLTSYQNCQQIDHRVNRRMSRVDNRFAGLEKLMLAQDQLLSNTKAQLDSVSTVVADHQEQLDELSPVARRILEADLDPAAVVAAILSEKDMAKVYNQTKANNEND